MTFYRRASPSGLRCRQRRVEPTETYSRKPKSAPISSCYRDHVDRWLPPPRRCGRSILLRNGSPLREFASGPLELKAAGCISASGEILCVILIATRCVCSQAQPEHLFEKCSLFFWPRIHLWRLHRDCELSDALAACAVTNLSRPSPIA